MAKKPMHPNSLANLRPQKAGEPTVGPNGRKGNDGKGGFSLKQHLKKMLANMEPADRDAFMSGILMKASTGDVAAFKLILEMNDELAQIATEDNGVRISIQVPAKEDQNGNDVQ